MQDSSWADRLELVGDDHRLVGSAGALPLRLLAERTGLRAGLSAAMNRRGFTPLYDRGQLLVDLAVTQLLGGEATSDFQGLRHVAPVIGPIPSNPTVWRALAEVGQLQLARINTAVTVFRRHWWGLLAARPEGFPWLKVAGRELTGITVMDLDGTSAVSVGRFGGAAQGAGPLLPGQGRLQRRCARALRAPLDLRASAAPSGSCLRAGPGPARSDAQRPRTSAARVAAGDDRGVGG